MITPLIAVGKILHCVGLRGGIKILPLTSSPKRFSEIKNCFIGKTNENVSPMRIAKVEHRIKDTLLYFEDFLSRTDAESLVGKLLFVPESERVQLPENEWFVDDIIGCRVFMEEKFIGCVSDVLKLPAQDVWSVRSVVNEEEILIPVAKEIVRSVDIANKIITLNYLEGLVNLKETEE
ncbi:MAG: ribosome maturation factor RimM [Bacteroidota bacterium]